MAALPFSFCEAIQRSLPGNERLVATAEVYDEGGHHALALTGTCLRVIDFATEPRFRLRPYIVVPLGFGAWVTWMTLAFGHVVVAIVAMVITLVVCKLVGTVDVAVPTVAGTTAVPISAITAAGVNGTTIDLRFAGGAWSFMTTDAGALRDLLAKLDVIRSGRMMATQTATVADALSRLAGLLADGAITAEEFEAAKHGLLGVRPNIANEVVGQLHGLFELHRAGGLSAAEWNQAKWDTLVTMTRASRVGR